MEIVHHWFSVFALAATALALFQLSLTVGLLLWDLDMPAHLRRKSHHAWRWSVVKNALFVCASFVALVVSVHAPQYRTALVMLCLFGALGFLVYQTRNSNADMAWVVFLGSLASLGALMLHP